MAHDKVMTHRQKAAQETRRKLVMAAREVLTEKPFEEVSVADITQAAGTCIGTFYVYFRHKEDIIEELRNHEFLHLAEAANRMSDKGMLERLAWYCREFMAGIEDGSIELCRQWVRENIAPRRMYDAIEDITKYHYDYRAMRSMLQQGVADGLLKPNTPVDDLALFINSQLYGLMTVWCMSDAAVVGSHETDRWCELFLAHALKPFLLNEE